MEVQDEIRLLSKQEAELADKVLLAYYRKNIVEKLCLEGFQKINKYIMMRATDNGLIEHIGLDKNVGYGGRWPVFTLGVGIQVTANACMIPECVELGCSFRAFVGDQKLYNYSTEEKTRESFADIVMLMDNYVMPWLNEMCDEEKALKAFMYPLENPDRNPTGHSDYELLLAGILAMRYGRLDRARELIDKGRKSIQGTPEGMDYGNMLMDLATKATREEQQDYIAFAEKKAKAILNIK